MFKNILVLFSTFLLAGCFATTKLVYVKVPVPACPSPIPVEKPQLEIDKLTEADKKDPGKVAKHYKATILQLEGYSKNLEVQLDEYERASKDAAEFLEFLKKRNPELFEQKDK